MNTTGTTTTLEPTFYEVVWGCDGTGRTVRVDHGDGSAISSGADMRATKVFIDMQAAGVPVGFYVNGELKAGVAHECELCGPPVAEHKTLTSERRVGERYVTRSNGSRGHWRPQRETIWACTCGNGGFGRDNDRADVRAQARRHREDPIGFPGRPGVRLAGLS